ncbi:type IV pilus secretin family protein [Kamptonema formosum]|uniref:type IV pilus secretin family protein n=1 Tax=Kamptonema formosum TaxID=331992 RepID=UPI000347425C|nr:type IV pilus secretin family protein [Oscillatoria sp. PCC 10802]
MRKYQELAFLLLGGGAVLVAQAAAAAAPTQVTGVQVRQTNQGVEVFLQTENGERPQIFTVVRGNDLVADVINTQLRLAQGNAFRQDNPYPGIASIAVSQLDANSIRVTVTGTGSPPAGQIVGRDARGILFGFSPGNGTAAASPVPPRPPSAGLPAIPPGPPAQVPPPPRPAAPSQPLPSSPSVMVPNPEVTIDGMPAAPGSVPPLAASPSAAPPLLPRAIAPPVGDIAISTTDSSGSTLDLGTNERVPRLVLRDAPVREVLSLLVRAAGLNIAFSGDTSAQPGQPGQPAQAAQAAAGAEGPRISLDIENEPVQDVFNYVLRLSGLQANRIGRTIFVGTRLPNELRDVVIRTFRMNQVGARQAAGFLASMGAESSVTTTQEETQVTAVPIQGTDQAITRTSTRVATRIEPLTAPPTVNVQPVLRGLQVLVDERLNTVTVVGPRRQVEIASAQLVQLDLRRRQVAVNVKIIDVNLSSQDNYNSSFSFGVGDSFFVNDGGSAAVNFGGLNPPSRTAATSTPLSPPITANPLATQEPFVNTNGLTAVPFTGPGGTTGLILDPRAPVTENPYSPGIATYTPGEADTAGSATAGMFPFIRYPKRFLSLLQAEVVSGNAKILTDPTLVVQEGQQAQVNLTQDVIGNVQTQVNATATQSTTTTTATITKAGLILGVQVQRIDDNGFITLNVTPKVTSIADTESFGGTTIALLAERSLSSGEIRLRDGQTLILSGIIQEQDRTNVTKVPILGDLPIIGALFRRTNRTNNRAEVIVVMTPQIIDDSERSPFGYGYTPGRDVRPLIQRQGLPTGNSPNP